MQDITFRNVCCCTVFFQLLFEWPKPDASKSRCKKWWQFVFGSDHLIGTEALVTAQSWLPRQVASSPVFIRRCYGCYILGWEFVDHPEDFNSNDCGPEILTCDQRCSQNELLTLLTLQPVVMMALILSPTIPDTLLA